VGLEVRAGADISVPRASVLRYMMRVPVAMIAPS
jgi:hypothetical protein